MTILRRSVVDEAPKTKAIPNSKNALANAPRMKYLMPASFEVKERLANPYVQSSQLFGFENHFKLKSSRYRLVYEVIETELYILVIAIGKRSKNIVYKKAKNRKR